MAHLSCYWHRLRAMEPAEIGAHVRKKLFQFADARREQDWASVRLESPEAFPKLPDRKSAPSVLREALSHDVEDILTGRWKAFGHLEIKVDDPPRWHTDYLAGKNLATSESAFGLNHRALPDGADIKLIWELSRWNQLVRLAQVGWLLDDERAGKKCVRWLDDWVARNPPYRGWNWTSALETGLRLMQFTWIDALLREQAKTCGYETELERLRSALLPAHVCFAWRHKSFGSSANNHLLGELAGMILATVRWPALAQWSATLETLQPLWEKEVVAQFAEDGGNREQALNYHLFSFELCWQTRTALLAAGKNISAMVEQRLVDAAKFFLEVQAMKDVWDYGDSDSAFVTPLFSSEQTVVQEWRGFLEGNTAGNTLAFWLGRPPGRDKSCKAVSAGEWRVYPQSGVALCESGFWFLRWDLSPLGYLRTAAHGHLDALHLSIWFKDMAVVIDPGTGAYYGNLRLRNWLASRKAHNGPCPVGLDFPKRLGPFLWSEHHAVPTWEKASPNGLIGELALPHGRVKRRVEHVADGLGWHVEDSFESRGGMSDEFTVRWQFAPGSLVKNLGERKFSINRADVSIVIEVDEKWNEVQLVESPVTREDLEGIVSPAFRQTAFAPYLKMTARSHKPCVFRTTFLACATS